jgi:hypothetical protein
MLSHFLFPEESAIATGVSVEASVGFPDIVDVKSTVNFQTTFTNTLAKAYVDRV